MSIQQTGKKNDSMLLSECARKLTRCTLSAKALMQKYSVCQARGIQCVWQDGLYITTAAIFLIGLGGYLVFRYIRRRKPVDNVECRRPDKIACLERQRDEAIDEKNKALLRLSETISSNLRDGNPNVADLSDENRPTKLSERLSELYDNEYTNAMAVLLKKQRTEKEIIKLLFDILKIVYECCIDASRWQIALIQQVLTSPFAEAADTDRQPQSLETSMKLPKEFLKRIKDERKSIKPQLSRIRNQVMQQIGTTNTIRSDIDEEDVKKYFNESTQLVWLMTVQDPPMYLEFKETRHENLRTYTQSGPEIDFHVWPSLHLYENGSLMAKGVAQFKD